MPKKRDRENNKESVSGQGSSANPSKDNRQWKTTSTGTGRLDKQSVRAASVSVTPPANAIEAAIAHWNDFWFGYEIEVSRLILFRFVLYGVLCVDWFFQVHRSLKYGFNGFNVAHFEWLDDERLLPTGDIMCFSWIILSLIAGRIATGIARQWESIGITVLYFYVYFISQIDNYQHHYFIFLLLAITCTIDWNQYKERSTELVNCWQMKLVLVQVSILYFWTAVTKLSFQWMQGALLKRMVSPIFNIIVRTTADTFGIPDALIWASGAIGTISMELYLMIQMHTKTMNRLVFFCGAAMHTIMHFSGLRIGLFSWYMVGSYVLVMPASWMEKITTVMQKLPFGEDNEEGKGGGLIKNIGLYFVLAGIGSVLLLQMPVDSIVAVLVTFNAVGLISLVIALIYDPKSIRNTAILNFLCLLLVYGLSEYKNRDEVVQMYIQRAHDYSRNNQLQAGVEMYEKVLTLDPTNADAQANTGLFYELLDQKDKALLYFKQSLAIDPTNLKALAGTARYQHEHKRPSAEVCQTLSKFNPTMGKHLNQLCNGFDCEELRRFADYAWNVYKQLSKEHRCNLPDVVVHKKWWT